MIDERGIGERYAKLAPHLDERQRRLLAASEVRAAGRGGLAAVARITGVARSTIGRGLHDLDDGTVLDARVRRAGGGRKPVAESDPGLIADLERLIEPSTRGDPERPLRWTTKSLRRLAAALRELGHRISHTVVGELLRGMDYSLQSNRKIREGADHPDRDDQFHYIDDSVTAALAAGEPAISVDCKKKELVGDFKNAGREWRRRGDPEPVRVHDFPIPELGKAVPYGIYDIGANDGWVSVGINHDTAAFAVNAIRSWWREMGRGRYPKATRLVVTADSGGSNSSRSRLWKTELQKLADEIGLALVIRHLPPGTSKWNKIEHRLFSFITKNWRATPLVTHQVILQLIGSTQTGTGLTVRCRLDDRDYPKGIAVSDADLAAVNRIADDFHGEWNYSILPKLHVPP